MTITLDSVREAARLADKLEALDDLSRAIESLKTGLVLVRFIPAGGRATALGEINAPTAEAAALVKALIKQTEADLRELGVDPDSTEGADNE